MRYFLLIYALVVVVIVGIAGTRGSLSRKPPIEVFPDMDRQLKLRPQQPNAFFPNGISSQPPVPGTVRRASPILTAAGPVLPFEDAPVNTGRLPGSTNFVELNPLPVTGALLRRGQERFNIYCAPCHGPQGDGNGITRKLGMTVVANLHDQRIVEMPDGEIFHTISYGKNLMQGYAAQIPVEDRWAIVAYVRVLQRSWLGHPEELPPELRAQLTR
ncbi:c-type cytochrome [Limisphaera sp. VF-2]|jgi:mono/diheme cytochrome c family protein|uniref:c-type cytochrome n=1 Tax=Limisphaera sp. VF-2 TaxID=3400418 RepID=UPI001755685C